MQMAASTCACSKLLSRHLLISGAVTELKESNEIINYVNSFVSQFCYIDAFYVKSVLSIFDSILYYKMTINMCNKNSMIEI